MKWILHVDGDAFFASCEVASRPWLKGKPVVTGRERGIATAVSYEAKARGVKRGMRPFEIRKICPDIVVLPSDYETYRIYAKRMYAIVRRYTPIVEEYSIDECFADITRVIANRMAASAQAQAAQIGPTSEQLGGAQGEKEKEKFAPAPAPTPALALAIATAIGREVKHDLEKELGITFSVGISVSKVAGKVASKWNKPSGLTVIGPADLPKYLAELPIGKVWGIGPSTSIMLRKTGIVSALDLAKRDRAWIEGNLSKPIREIYEELNGRSVYPVLDGVSASDPESLKRDYQSISRTGTFSPPSVDRAYVFSELSSHVEDACSKLRQTRLLAKRISFFIKTQSFEYIHREQTLAVPTDAPQDVLKAIHSEFDRMFNLGAQHGMKFRATGVTLSLLTRAECITGNMFENSPAAAQATSTDSPASSASASASGATLRAISKTVDRLIEMYGSKAICLASSLKVFKPASRAAHRAAARGAAHSADRKIDVPDVPAVSDVHGRRFGLPFLGEVR